VSDGGADWAYHIGSVRDMASLVSLFSRLA
jgi:hypothetical protein